MSPSEVHDVIREFDNSEDAHHIVEKLVVEGINDFELTLEKCVECGEIAYSIHPSSDMKHPTECDYCGKMACYTVEVVEINKL